jgi:arylsulfatase A-like enzyme
MDVHDPYTPPDAAKPVPPLGLPKPLARGWVLETARRINFQGAAKLPPEHVAWLRALYDAEVRAWDAGLPALLDGLRDAGVLDSTVIVVTSDHGEEFQEHGFLKHGQTLYEELVHVPLLMAGPSVPRGRRSAQVQGIDLYPTLARIMGAPVPRGLAGRDLLATDLADVDVISETSHAVGEGGATVDARALRTPVWTLLAYPKERHLLFHRPDDPGELTDRFTSTPEGPALAQTLQSLLAAAPAPPRTTPVAGDLRERLRQLGYAD